MYSVVNINSNIVIFKLARRLELKIPSTKEKR